MTLDRTPHRSRMVLKPLGPEERRFCLPSRNGAWAGVKAHKPSAVATLRHHAHYVDRLPKGDHRDFHRELYLSSADAVGAWG